jgi:serine/threonine protein kinase
MGEVLGGRFEVLGPLGSGILGDVVRVRDATTGREKAIKLLKPERMTPSSRGRFEREFEAISRIAHPNVIRVEEWGFHGDRPFFVMELLEGDVLDVFADRTRPGPGLNFDSFAPRIAYVFQQIADALDAVHAAGVIHRDLKPQNIIVADGRFPRAKLFDFGHAKEDDHRHLTTTGTVLGTASYIAPEHAMGRPAGPPADLYALGCVLFQALTGRTPYQGGTVLEVLLAHVNAPAPDPRTYEKRVPAELAELCLHLMRKAPAQRPASAGAVAALLARFD